MSDIPLSHSSIRVIRGAPVGLYLDVLLDIRNGSKRINFHLHSSVWLPHTAHNW